MLKSVGQWLCELHDANMASLPHVHGYCSSSRYYTRCSSFPLVHKMLDRLSLSGRVCSCPTLRHVTLMNKSPMGRNADIVHSMQRTSSRGLQGFGLQGVTFLHLKMVLSVCTAHSKRVPQEICDISARIWMSLRHHQSCSQIIKTRLETWIAVGCIPLL